MVDIERWRKKPSRLVAALHDPGCPPNRQGSVQIDADMLFLRPRRWRNLLLDLPPQLGKKTQPRILVDGFSGGCCFSANLYIQTIGVPKRTTIHQGEP
jgi:hypothetical protein